MKVPALLLFSVLIGSFLQAGDYDSYLEEKNPGKSVIQPEQGSEFTFYIPGFLPWGDGIMGAKGIEAGVQFGGDTLLKNLDMAALAGLEGRKGKFGFILEGMYLNVGVSGTTPGRLLSTVAVSFDQTIAEATGTYRILESDRGFVELLAGARLISVNSSLSFAVDSAGVASLSNDLSERIVSRTASAVREKVDKSLPAILASLPAAAANLSNGDVNGLEERLDRDLAAIWPLIERRISDGVGSEESGFGSSIASSSLVRRQVENYLKARLQSQIEQRRAAASAAVATARSAERAQADRQLAKAEKKLSKAIESQVKGVLSNSSVSDSKSWVDPIVGIRGQWLVTDDIYFVARADYGGFGISSESTYNLYGAFGTQVKANTTIELGIRSMGVDYRRGGFVYDMGLTGPFMGTRIVF
ncbi:MAG: hypothetical protein P1U87_07685 [Verrucomicrobiales bacterium]|nr:hypothetical protein [Verrucomicrobiales bacterium]